MGDPLYNTVALSHRAVEAIDNALSDALTDANDQVGDKANARASLTRALAAARSIRDHLERAYEYLNGQSYAKEEQ